MAQTPEQPAPRDSDGSSADSAPVEQALDGAQESLDQVRRAVDEQAAAGDAQGSGAVEAPAEDTAPAGIELLGDVDLDVTIELGRTEMLVEDVLRLTGGSVVELDKLAGDPVDVHVNGRLVARGEVLVLNDNFCIRINEIVADLEEEAEAAAEREQARSPQREAGRTEAGDSGDAGTARRAAG